MSDLKKHVETLIEKAAEPGISPDAALKFSQAATNSANAMSTLATAGKPKPMGWWHIGCSVFSGTEDYHGEASSDEDALYLVNMMNELIKPENPPNNPNGKQGD